MQKAASKARAVELLKIKNEILAKKEENQKELDDALAKMFENAPKIEEMMKNQKTAEGKNSMKMAIFHNCQLLIGHLLGHLPPKS